MAFRTVLQMNCCSIMAPLPFTSHALKEVSDLKQQVAELKKKHKVEVTLAVASPNGN